MIYKHANWGDDKVYSVSANCSGSTTIKEYSKQIKKTELVIPEYQVQSFLNKLTKDGWVEQQR